MFSTTSFDCALEGVVRALHVEVRLDGPTRHGRADIELDELVAVLRIPVLADRVRLPVGLGAVDGLDDRVGDEPVFLHVEDDLTGAADEGLLADEADGRAVRRVDGRLHVHPGAAEHRLVLYGAVRSTRPTSSTQPLATPVTPTASAVNDHKRARPRREFRELAAGGPPLARRRPSSRRWKRGTGAA